MLVPVEISSFAVDPKKGTPLVVLKEAGDGRSIAVPVDHAEASAIAMHSLKIAADKPFPIDLVRIVVEQLGGELYRAVISDVADEAFSACIVVKAESSMKVIDCRPGDAIALAVKCGAPVFVRDVVFARLFSDKGQSEEEQLRARVRSIDTLEFGRYVLE